MNASRDAADTVPFWRGRAKVLLAYFVAALIAPTVAHLAPVTHPLAVGLVADLAATVVVFAFSLLFRNASMYDAYWSVAPPILAAWWILWVPSPGHPVRQALVLGLITLWAWRLTANWLRTWTDDAHEDWRYGRLREQTGVFYPLVNLGGIHLFPTLMVFACMVPVWFALTTPAPLGVADLLAAVVTAAAIALEAGADRQLHAFRAQATPGAVMRTGLWSMSRHPNYLGELGFWWGLWGFALATDLGHAWTVIGPLGMAAMFRFVSIPMIEARMLARRPAYADVLADIPMLLPGWPAPARPATPEPQPPATPAQPPAAPAPAPPATSPTAPPPPASASAPDATPAADAHEPPTALVEADDT